MNYTEQLKQHAEQKQSIVCMGLDPVLNKIPIEGTPEQKLTRFYLEILNALESENTFPASIKPNIAFYEQYGLDGLRALKTIIKAYKNKNIPVILDAKRGDIGKTCKAYANAIFDYWQANAVTVHPYLGSDSVLPFTEKGGVYVLVRTSNKSARELQDLEINQTQLFKKVAEKVIEWNTGAVIGATYPEELHLLSKLFVDSGKETPLLIPGVGAQGGSAEEVINILKNTGNNPLLHRINSSSGINYAYLKQNTDDFAGAAVKALKELNKEINL